MRTTGAANSFLLSPAVSDRAGGLADAGHKAGGFPDILRSFLPDNGMLSGVDARPSPRPGTAIIRQSPQSKPTPEQTPDGIQDMPPEPGFDLLPMGAPMVGAAPNPVPAPSAPHTDMAPPITTRQGANPALPAGDTAPVSAKFHATEPPVQDVPLPVMPDASSPADPAGWQINQTPLASSTITAPHPPTPAPTPAPAPQSVILPMATTAWPETLVQTISRAPFDDGDNLTLTLTPERLGKLHIRLDLREGQTHVHIVTETPEAARILTEAQHRLGELMSRAQLELGEHSTSFAGSGTGGHGGALAHQQAQWMPQNPDAPAMPESPDPTPRPMRPSSLSTVDLLA